MRVVLQTPLNMLPKASILFIIDRNGRFVLIMCFVWLFTKQTGSSKFCVFHCVRYQNYSL